MHERVRTLAVGPSLPVSPPAVAVLAGDLLVLSALVGTGLHRHYGSYPWEIPGYALSTLAPFLLAWLVIAALTGVYHRATLTDYRRTLGLLLLAWPLAAVGGSALRAGFFGGGAPLTFVLVMVVLGTLFLLPWRVAAVACRRTGDRPVTVILPAVSP